MSLDEYARCDALALAELVKRGDAKPRELCELAITAVERVNPELNAVLDVYTDVLDRVDRESPPDGPFEGVPFFLKDIGAAEKGRPYEAGSRLLSGYVAEGDTTLMERYRSAGLLNLGRTAAPELGYTITTESVLNGATRNPWNPERIAGGSSGGAAAIVAAGVVPMAHANDGAGSIRIPASCNGLVGLKHSRGRVSQGPLLSDLVGFLYTEHVVSRTVRDTAALLDAVHGPAVGEAFEIAPPERRYLSELTRAPEPLRIGFCAGAWGPYDPAPEVAAGVEDTARLCEELGHRVTAVAAPVDVAGFFAAGMSTWYGLLPVELDHFAALVQRPVDETTVEPIVLQAYRRGKEMRATEWIAALTAANWISRELGAFFREYDVLLTPTLAVPPPSLGLYHMNQPDANLDEYFASVWEIIPYTPLANFTGVPAISLPLCESPDGLPIGMHFMAAFGREGLLLHLAGTLEQARPWIERRPRIHVTS